jgi:hypothetical protein
MDTDLLSAAAPTGADTAAAPPIRSRTATMRRTHTRKAALLAAGLAWLAIAAPAAATLRIAELGAAAAPGEPAVIVDGQLDDPAWQSATRIELAYENNPGDNTAAGVRTTALMFHTGDALYLAFRAEDPDPAAIRAFLRDRDALYEDDFVGIQIDTFDDQRRAYEMFVNPFGVQADGLFDETRNVGDASWDGLWSSAGRITGEGFETEMRIPFSTLRFPAGAVPRRWGLRLMRIRPRDYLYVYFDRPRPRGAACNLCTMGKLEAPSGIRGGRGLEIVPTLTVGHAQRREAGAWRSLDDARIEPGLDVVWTPSPDLAFGGTLNPDFSQVESDTARLDPTSNFALFFPEKRPFFLEGSDYFNMPLNAVYTRQIADPDLGLRATGRSGRHAYSVIAARDATTTLLLPGALGSELRVLDAPNDALIARYRHDLAGRASIGALATYRQGEDYRNALLGVDLRWLHGPHTLDAQWLRSASRYPAGIRDEDPRIAGHAGLVEYRYSDSRWTARLHHTRIGSGFAADLGFIGQVDFRRSVVGGSRSWYGAPGAALNKIVLSGDWRITRDTGGALLERQAEAGLSVSGPLQATYALSALARTRAWDGRLFDERWGSASATLTARPGLKLSMGLRAGEQLDLVAARIGQVREWQPAMVLDAGRGVSLHLSHLRQRLHRDGDVAFDVQVLDARFGWQFDPRQRLRLSLQSIDMRRDPARYLGPVASRERAIGAQLIYSYRIDPRTGLYAGYAHAGFSDAAGEDLSDRSRSLFLKLSYAWLP